MNPPMRVFAMITTFAIIALTALCADAPQQDPVIEAARAEAAEYAASVPDYLVTRTTTRYQRRDVLSTHTVGPPSMVTATGWREVDSVSAEVATEHGKEVYSAIKINGKPAKALPQGGVWSAGEFSTLLKEVLAPAHAAVFTGQRADTKARRPAWRYNFAIDPAHSGWDMDARMPGSRAPIHITPAYSGAIWIDRETNKVLRIEKTASGIPKEFPLDVVEAATDYDFVEIGSDHYLLPVSSETVTCLRGGTLCYRNTTVFRNYRKFNADAKISFDQ